MIKVLIADDQELIRQSLQIVLNTKEDMQVTGTAADGQEVIQCIRKEVPDVILMDIRMPLLDGYEAIHHIRQSGLADAHRIPIIAMTANAFVEDVQASLDAGMNGHLAKPIVMEEVIKTILMNLNR